MWEVTAEHGYEQPVNVGDSAVAIAAILLMLQLVDITGPLAIRPSGRSS